MYFNDNYVYKNILDRDSPPKVILCIDIKLEARIININYAGKSCKSLFIDSKFAKSFALKYFLSSSVIAAPIFFLDSTVLCKNIKGRNYI
jgi:hypothetical protein